MLLVVTPCAVGYLGPQQHFLTPRYRVQQSWDPPSPPPPFLLTFSTSHAPPLHSGTDIILVQLSVALRTAADGSFERTVLIPENLQEVVPCKDEVTGAVCDEE